MASTAKRTNPELWEKVKEEVTRGAKGGRKGQWSARKAQLAVQIYKARGGEYEGPKAKDNSLRQWTDEEWGTKSGEKSLETGERYLPKSAREALSPAEYARTTRKKRADTRQGRQFSAQPAGVKKKVAQARRRRARDKSPRPAAGPPPGNNKPGTRETPTGATRPPQRGDATTGGGDVACGASPGRSIREIHTPRCPDPAWVT